MIHALCLECSCPVMPHPADSSFFKAQTSLGKEVCTVLPRRLWATPGYTAPVRSSVCCPLSAAGDGSLMTALSGQYPAVPDSCCHLNTQRKAGDLSFLHVQHREGQPADSGSRATHRGWRLLLGLSPLAGTAGELGCEFPCRLLPFHLNQMSGCWGLASSTFLGVPHSSLQRSDGPVEGLCQENKLFPESTFLGGVFNRLDTVRKYFLSKETQEQSGGAQNPCTVSLCGCRTPPGDPPPPGASCPA